MIIERMRKTNPGETICLSYEECEEVLKLIEEQEERIAIMSEGGWISVDERLPEDETDVLLYGEWNGIVIAYHSEGKWYDYQHCILKNRTHWMPCPEPPKEGEAE